MSKQLTWVALLLSVGAVASVAVAWSKLDRRLADLKTQVESQSKELGELRGQARRAGHLAAIEDAVRSWSPGVQSVGSGAVSAGNLGIPQAPSEVATPAATAEFLSRTGISPEVWHAVQKDNATATAALLEVSAALADATPEVATKRLDEIEARRDAAQRKRLTAAQMKAYEEFRAAGPAQAQITCAGGAVRRMIREY